MGIQPDSEEDGDCFGRNNEPLDLIF